VEVGKGDGLKNFYDLGRTMFEGEDLGGPVTLPYPSLAKTFD